MDRLTVMDTGCETVSLLLRSMNAAWIAGRSATLISAGSIRDGKQLTLPVTVNGEAGVATLDSGARSTMINNTFAKAARIDPARSPSATGRPRVAPSRTVSLRGSARSTQ